MIEKQKADCCGCNACVQVCPKKCILMMEDDEGFLYPKVDEKNCVECGMCEKVCPMHPKENTIDSFPPAYAAYSLEETVRMKSSSGGIFSALAEEVLKRGGAVFGAAMRDDCYGVKHILVENEIDLDKLRGSKYVQSSIENTFDQTKKILRTGRWVLYSGTPCQIEGLKAFLQKDYENLLCIDLICHGVPSQKLWSNYVHDIEKRKKVKLNQVCFRGKEKYGWKFSSLDMFFSNGSKKQVVFTKSVFGFGFVENFTLRPACYSCPFKKMNRVADVTLADFWGAQEEFPDLDDNKGLSLVIVHSQKGKQFLQDIASGIVLREATKSWLDKNPAMIKSSGCPTKRTEFFRKIDKVSIGRALFECLSFQAKIKWLVPADLKDKVKKYIKRNL